MEPQIRILIAEDHHLVAKLLKSELETVPGLHVIAIKEDGREAIEMLAQTEIDVMLLDIHMQKVDGMAVLKEINGKYPQLKIIMLTNETDGNTIHKAIKSGANGYITKFADSDDIIKAIHSVLSGETYFDKLSLHNFIDNFKNGKANGNGNGNGNSHTLSNNLSAEILRQNYPAGLRTGLAVNKIDNLDILTAREKEVLKMIIEEKTTKIISENLYISCRTVETHRKNILQKLGLKNSMCLMKFIMENETRIAV